MVVAVGLTLAVGLGAVGGYALRPAPPTGRPRAVSATDARLVAAIEALSAAQTARPANDPAAAAIQAQLDGLRHQLTARDSVLPTTAGDATNPPTITVTGVGTVLATPDVVTFSVGVNLTRPSARDAMASADAEAARVVSALEAHGVAGRDIQTQFVSLGRSYQPAGYTAGDSVTVKIRNLATAGSTVGAAADAAGSDATLYGPAFDLQDNARMVAAARALAVADAASHAADYARLVGRKLGPAHSATENSSALPAPSQCCPGSAGGGAAGPAATPMAPPVPIQPGQQAVVVVITVTYDVS